MFLGHFGLALAAKKINSKPSLGSTMMAAQFVDLLWPLLLLLNIERVTVEPGNTVVTPLNFEFYPYSHSLVAGIIWAVLFGLTFYLLKRDIWSAVLLGGLVVSHWLLDLVVHRPDLPLWFSDEHKVGLGLWNSVTATVIAEMVLFFSGVFIYASTTSAKNRVGRFAYWGLIIFLLAVEVSNLFSPPPPNATVIGYVGLSQWLIIAWAYWIDRNRVDS